MRIDRLARLGALLTCLVSMGCDNGGTPTLQMLSPQTVFVQEQLQLPIGIDNPDARPVELTYEDPMLPGFDRVVMLSTQPGGGLFRWAPLSSHVGNHEIVFILREPGGGDEYDRQSVLIDVRPAQDAAPVFVRPGAGGTFDLERSSCVAFDIEVRDDDSSTVMIGARAELPTGATISIAGEKRASFSWCPTADQVNASERWTIPLFADDGQHPRVEHDYIAVLRAGPKEDCPGAAPTVTLRSPIAGERITSGSTFAVRIEVADDMGLRDPPLLHYTATEPQDSTKPDLAQFEGLATFEDVDGAWVANIASLGLAAGEEREIFFVVSATDNDDPNGTACDHRTDTPLVGFYAVGGTRADGTLAECAPCTASSECASGMCASSAEGGRCVPSCSGDGVCSRGVCGATVTVEGATRAGCGPVRDVCNGGAACTDDPREDDDTPATASAYSSPILDGQICAEDFDFVALTVERGYRVSVVLDGFTHAAGDLDLQLRDAGGTILASSASTNNLESVTYCNGQASGAFYARVAGWRRAQNNYRLTAQIARDPGGCCVDDRREDDDTRETARAATFMTDAAGELAEVRGTLCPSDDDWIAIPMSAAGRIEAVVGFQTAMGDVDIELYSPTGARIASSASVTNTESLTADVPAGTYALRVFLYRGMSANYEALLTRRVGTSCTRTNQCPLGTVCATASCAAVACTSPAACPSAHLCPTVPSGAARTCASSCTSNADCRQYEACKWVVEGRACGATGRGANGASCASSADCGGQRDCVGWPGGYCARVGCRSNGDCEGGTFCVARNGLNVCAAPCTGADSCRAAEGYACAVVGDVTSTSRSVCVPR